MPNIALLLKQEIARISRKEIRTETNGLRKAIAGYRSDIATLKRRAQALEQEVKRLSKGVQPAETAYSDNHEVPLTRFSAKALAAQRRRLGLSAADCGRLVGASGLSIYKWESGQASPRAKYLNALGELRKLGKKEAAVRLSQLP